MNRRAPRALLAGVAAGGLTLAAAFVSTPADASSGHRTVGVLRGAHAGFNMTQSNNWSGYNKGLIETRTPFHAITGQWTVPTATQRVSGRAEHSSTWIGIGGGCLTTACTVTDSTLIQAGTEQDVASNGAASYSSWFELIPAPSLSTPLAVHAGDAMFASIVEKVPGVWKIVLRNFTTGGSWSTTVPYSSTYGSAEWIEETPLTFGTGGAGLSAMPNLGSVHFDLATANGANAALKPAERIQLVATNGSVVATPSNPDAQFDGFNDCTYSSSC
ncbi:MAG: hypothetical protein QOF18_1485 [Frankiaceae bacterium]|jgi:hypothetical protein|nr:hypothetical protein [Frankiaceae bacterium]